MTKQLEEILEEEYLECPQCKKRTESLYRNKPKGEKADFVCIHCVPPSMRPDNETVMVANGIWEAINN